MSQRTRYILIVTGLNLLAGVLLFAIPPLWGSDGLEGTLFLFLFVVPAILLLQLVLGLVLALGTRHKALGQALLLFTGVILLIGLSVCGVIAF